MLFALLALLGPTPSMAQSLPQNDLAASMAFAPAAIDAGKPTLLRVRLNNRNSDATVSGIAYDMPFPTGMRFYATPDLTQCGGSITPVATGYQFRGGRLGMSDGCLVDTVVTVDSAVSLDLTVTVAPVTSTNGGSVRSISATLAVAAGGLPPRITSPVLPAVGLLGVDYAHQVTVTGSEPIAVTAEGLPPGLTYDDATRRVSGRPTLAGTYTVTLRATNAFPPPDAQVSTVEIRNPPLQIVTMPPLSPAPLLIGRPVSIQFEATGGVGPYRWDVAGGTLPEGLSLDADGRISGVPTQPGAHTFVARVRDAVGQQDTRSYELAAAKIPTTLRIGVAPNPAVVGQVVGVSATVEPTIGPAPGGTLDVWVAGPGTRCPDDFEPATADPVTTQTRSVAVSGGAANASFPDLSIGRLRVCALYGGGPLHDASRFGPADLYVIKGVLLPSPGVKLDVPARVRAGDTIAGQVRVEGADGGATPGGTVRVRAGARDLGEIPVVGGAAAFALEAPAEPGVVALTASYAGDAAYAPAAAEPAYVTVSKASVAEPIPTLGETAAVLLALMLGALAVARLRRR